MAFVATSDEFGNKTTRMILSYDPSNRTVAALYEPKVRNRDHPLGRYDYRMRFHRYAPEKGDEEEVGVEVEEDKTLINDPTTDNKPDNKDDTSEMDEVWSADEVNAHSTMCSVILRASSSSSPPPPPTPSRSLTNRSVNRNRMTYNSWLAGKNEQEYQVNKERRLKAERQAIEKKKRANQASEKYQNWCAEKTKSNHHSNHQQNSKRSEMNNGDHRRSSNRREVSTFRTPEVERHLIEWERKKMQELQSKRQQELERETKKLEDERLRRERGDLAWKDWLGTARNRPKPVAMGQGIASLQATNAKLYVNPNEWKSIATEAAGEAEATDDAPIMPPIMPPIKPNLINARRSRLERMPETRKSEVWHQINTPIRRLTTTATTANRSTPTGKTKEKSIIKSKLNNERQSQLSKTITSTKTTTKTTTTTTTNKGPIWVPIGKKPSPLLRSKSTHIGKGHYENVNNWQSNCRTLGRELSSTALKATWKLVNHQESNRIESLTKTTTPKDQEQSMKIQSESKNSFGLKDPEKWNMKIDKLRKELLEWSVAFEKEKIKLPKGEQQQQQKTKVDNNRTITNSSNNNNNSRRIISNVTKNKNDDRNDRNLIKEKNKILISTLSSSSSKSKSTSLTPTAFRNQNKVQKKPQWY